MKLESLKLEKGDIFLTKNPMMLGKIINFVQKLWSQDNSSMYSHAGVIISENGDTFEALLTIKASKLEEYKGKEILISRYNKINTKKFRNGMNSILENKGDIYPFHRLFLMIVPALGKINLTGQTVCSEIVGKFLNACGVDINWKGLTPDGLHDFIKNHRDFDIIYKGKLS